MVVDIINGFIHYDLILKNEIEKYVYIMSTYNAFTVGRKNGIIEKLVSTNQLFVAKNAHYIRQFYPSQKMVSLTVDIDFCSFDEANN